MDCDVAREALSARIDGEREPIPAVRVDEHLADCESCRRWQADAVEQTQVLRRLAGRSQLAAVRSAPAGRSPEVRRLSEWGPRCALGVVGVIQVALAVAQGLGAELGVPDAATAGHVVNESTAFSAAVGVTMLAAAIRPIAAGGLTWVLATFVAFLFLYEISDTDAGREGIGRPLTHLPVVVGAVLALLVWRRVRTGDGPRPDQAAKGVPDDIVLPDNASRGRRRSHLRSSDGSAA